MSIAHSVRVRHPTRKKISVISTKRTLEARRRKVCIEHATRDLVQVKVEDVPVARVVRDSAGAVGRGDLVARGP
eukprot:5239021-Pleurochrysis_carterae.AAC.3